MPKLEFLAFLLFDDDARAEELPATLTEKRAGFLIDAAPLRDASNKRHGFIYLLKPHEVIAIDDICEAITSDPTPHIDCAYLAEQFRREIREFRAICYELNV